MVGDQPRSATSTMNELDRMSLMKKNKSTEDSVQTTEKRERITCTIDAKDNINAGDRRVFVSSDRGRGGFRGRGRLDGGRLSFPGRPGQEGRFNQRGNFGQGDINDRGRRRSEIHEDREEPVDPNKPQLKLIDPEFVPRGRGYFDHDDREKDAWRGKDFYDPRRDSGFRKDRRRESDHQTTWRGFDRPNNGAQSFNHGRFDRGSAADGVWTHDKFLELEGGGDDQENKDKDAPESTANEARPNEVTQKKDTRGEKDRRRSRSREHSRSRSRSRERYGNRRFTEEANNRRGGYNKNREPYRRRRSPSPFRNRGRRY